MSILIKKILQERFMNEGKRSSKEERIEYVNDHRNALGHPEIPHNIHNTELKRHEKLINKHAPYGNDPWGDEELSESTDYASAKSKANAASKKAYDLETSDAHYKAAKAHLKAHETATTDKMKDFHYGETEKHLDAMETSSGSLKENEFAELDEVSSKTLGSYLKKSKSDVGDLQATLSDSPYRHERRKALHKIIKRERGYDTAIDKLVKKSSTNESIELDEAKAKSYEELAKHAKATSKEVENSDGSDWESMTHDAIIAHHEAASAAIKSGNSKMALHHIKMAKDHHDALL